jgi:hypothetical protein
LNESGADATDVARRRTVSAGAEPAWTWLPACQQVLKLLAENPEVRESNPRRALYFAVEAAELGEPGAMAALIDLKMSANPQFQDRPGACKLIETAAKSGDQVLAQRLTECRAN